MGVYIEGMEMPTKENAVILITPSGDVWMIGDMPNEDTHLVKAKAVPVPPHGRLIDADALMLLRNMTRPNCEFVGDRLMIDVNMIDGAPTVIPASKEE